jgi:hypothetical protein
VKLRICIPDLPGKTQQQKMASQFATLEDFFDFD